MVKRRGTFNLTRATFRKFTEAELEEIFTWLGQFYNGMRQVTTIKRRIAGETLADIAKDTLTLNGDRNVSRNQVRQIELQALRRIRFYAAVNKLGVVIEWPDGED